MIGICYVEEFFNSLSLRELNKCMRVCKLWHKYIDKHPELFRFKYPIKFYYNPNMYLSSDILSML